ncbi:hypothetical protein BA190_12590 [Labrys sp. WJW]|uniref:DUF5691 domain-containing protein n=1 Tax=Labrys sp. WJW TaxID=1737983 RepID=UPI00082CDF7F|nr:DUF5691 domain-containing protein [Labrys sp. WJW]OCC04544.1 hypothetical protein BA190_12590 [Labrys sp. WJW]
MLDATSAEALMRGFLLGTGRQAVPIARAFDGILDAKAEKVQLQALALLGQHQRFLRRWSRRVEAKRPAFEDSRALPPPAARPLMVSLLSGKNGSADDGLAYAIADTLDRRRMKIHPFDLPRLEGFARLHAERLGTSALAWVNRNAVPEEGDEENPYFFVERIDASNWQQGWPSQKAGFIREQRRVDAARARDLVAAALASERAPVRATLVKALAVGLSTADAPFLESLATDRAPSVRDVAEVLLGRLPGSVASTRKLQECIGRIKVAKTGLLRRGRTLSLDYPATIRPYQQQQWAFQAFAGVGLDQLAQGLAMSVEEIGKAAADAILGLVLAALAVREGRWSLLAGLSEGRSDLWPILDQVEEADLGEAAVPALQAALVRPALWSELPTAEQWTKLYMVLRSPLSSTMFKSIVASKAWRSLPAGTDDTPTASTAAILSAIAALSPAAERGGLRAELRSFGPALTSRASQGLNLLDLLDSA